MRQPQKMGGITYMQGSGKLYPAVSAGTARWGRWCGSSDANAEEGKIVGVFLRSLEAFLT